MLPMETDQKQIGLGETRKSWGLDTALIIRTYLCFLHLVLVLRRLISTKKNIMDALLKFKRRCSTISMRKGPDITRPLMVVQEFINTTTKTSDSEC